MKKEYVILRYNFYRDVWERVFYTSSKKVAFVKYRQYRLNFPYFNYILREEVVIDEN